MIVVLCPADAEISGGIAGHTRDLKQRLPAQSISAILGRLLSLAHEALVCPQHTNILTWAEESGFKAPQGPVLEPKARQNQCNTHGLQRCSLYRLLLELAASRSPVWAEEARTSATDT